MYRGIRARLAAALLVTGFHGGTPHPDTHVHEVRMRVRGNVYVFEPARVEVAVGDTVAFVVESGEPHDVAFDTTALSPAVRQRLRTHMHDEIAPFAGPLLLHRNDRFVVSFVGIPAGEYPFFCLPHLALNMKGKVIVR